MTLKFRREGELPKCAVVGCREYPGKKLYHRDFCEPHAREVSELVAEHNYREFMEALKLHGCEPKVSFYPDAGFRWMQLKCSVPPCDKLARDGIGGSVFGGSKEGLFLYLCEDHGRTLQDVLAKDFGSKLVWKLTQKPKFPGDNQRTKRIRAIHERAAKHQGKPEYVKKVCADLKAKHIKMPPTWFGRWEIKFKENFDDWLKDDWRRAYQDDRFRPDVQRYISRHCGSTPTLIEFIV